MKGRIAVIAAVFFFYLLFACRGVSAFQFENYKWGKTKEEIRALIEAGHSKVPARTAKGLTYGDIIFGQSCRVNLIFTPDTNLLTAVIIKWQGNTIGQKLKADLSQKYGEPRRSGDLRNEYFWSAGNDKLTLNYKSMNTELTYYNMADVKDYFAEQKENPKKDIDKF
ncbi:MAG: hypothetical protein ABIH57_02665 [Candidatus Omnitrophota bacterium]